MTAKKSFEPFTALILALPFEILPSPAMLTVRPLFQPIVPQFRATSFDSGSAFGNFLAVLEVTRPRNGPPLPPPAPMYYKDTHSPQGFGQHS